MENILESAVLAFWNEGMMPEMISQKLGYPLDSVEDIIEAPGNYISQKELGERLNDHQK